MAKKLFVGNLPWRSTQEELTEVFEQYGNVLSLKLIYDRETGRSRGFGFVEMEDADAQAAMEALDGKDFNGRELRVNEAMDRERRPRY
jgi:RNA recognition motif-containing protein